QALIPILGTEPIELGLKGHEDRFLEEIGRDAVYRKLFPEAFSGEKPFFTMSNVTKAIASFERTLISVNSPYDRYRYGNDSKAISDAAKRGEVLFFSGERTGCFQCHGSWNLNGALRYEGGAAPRVAFLNTGLYNIRGEFSYPASNTGLYQFTKRREDIGKFRAPTLRNIAVTAPYMHDGSIATLPDVIDHYAAGGRTITAGALSGSGDDKPNKASNPPGFFFSGAAEQKLVAFFLRLPGNQIFFHTPVFFSLA